LSDLDLRFLHQALDEALLGQGLVEPNPMVGCVIVKDVAERPEVVGTGYHRKFGGPHAEIEALQVAGEAARGGTMYVTLEPCCHFGKTPPCSRAVIAAGLKRVVIAHRDPNPLVAGQGEAELRAAGIEVQVGLLADKAQQVMAPYLKLMQTGRPWVIAKWAMTLDGKLATHTGESKWISGPAAREIVQRLRSRMDAILVGSRTALLDDPLLTARLHDGSPPARIATRVVVDSSAALPLASKLVLSAREVPLLLAVSQQAETAKIEALRGAGAEVVPIAGTTPAERLSALLTELGRRKLTNVLCEGGGQLLGSLFDGGHIDEVHAFVAPKIFGGAQAASPVAGAGVASPGLAFELVDPQRQIVGNDYYCHGRLKRRP
jgi:diaminohydroxyphosphoribosylaminopyrimidine deaminase/5-amino-6-(5-phosphoribosylamino)uracil reductase